MKSIKRVFSFLLALLMIATVFVVPTPVEAATKKADVLKQVHIGPKSSFSIQVNYANEGDQLKNIKSSSKNLVVRQTSQREYAVPPDSMKGAGFIGLYAEKEGTYTVKFDVYSKAGKKRSSHKVTVYVKPMEPPVASVKLDGKNIISNDGSQVLFNKTSAKLSVKMTKGYKLKKIEVYREEPGYDNDKHYVRFTKVKKVKNNTKIQLSKGGYNSSSDNGWVKDMYAETRIQITYLDKYSKEELTVTYYVYRILKK